jgi:hypothetical protein
MTISAAAAAKAKANNNNANKLSSPIELPSLEEIEAMEKQQQNAIDSLEIIQGSKAKCQRCSQAIPIVGRLQRPKGHTRIDTLQKMLSYLENQSRDIDSAKRLKEEIAQLEAEESKRDKLRSLPLYSCKITSWKFVCSKCYDDLYQISQQEQRKR